MKADFITRWCNVFRILGLDYTRPLWEIMGLNIPQKMKSQLPPFLRDADTQCQKKPDYLSAYVLVETTLERIATNLENAISLELRTWCDKYFLSHRDKCDRSYTWRSLLATMGAHYPGLSNKPETNALGWELERYHYLLNFIKNKFSIPFLESEEIIDELEERVDETKCSDWNVNIFSGIRQQDGDVIIIFALITETALNFHLSTFWDRLEEEFTQAEITSIVNWVKTKSGKNCIPLVLEERGD
jgi:hypothetical protein